jgi:hypothetical protein
MKYSEGLEDMKRGIFRKYPTRFIHKWKTNRNPSILNDTHVGEHLSPITTTFKEESQGQSIMASHSVSRVENRQLAMAESQRHQYEEVSRWSNSTESSSDYGSASSSEENGSAYLEPLEPELYEARLGRWEESFDNRPLMRCLHSEEESVDKQLEQGLMFERLLNEVQVSLSEMSSAKDIYRSRVKVRYFWENVRASLRDESDKDPCVVDWPPTDELTLDGQIDTPLLKPKVDTSKPVRSADGKDPVLVEIRNSIKGTWRGDDEVATTDPPTATLKHSATAPSGSSFIKRLSSSSTATASLSPSWIPFLRKASSSTSITSSTKASTR